MMTRDPLDERGLSDDECVTLLVLLARYLREYSELGRRTGIEDIADDCYESLDAGERTETARAAYYLIKEALSR